MLMMQLSKKTKYFVSMGGMLFAGVVDHNPARLSAQCVIARDQTGGGIGDPCMVGSNTLSD